MKSPGEKDVSMVQGISFGPDYKVRLPDRFNVAVPFIDRHVAEGAGPRSRSGPCTARTSPMPSWPRT